MVERLRCFCWSSLTTLTYVAAIPFFQTFSAESVQPGTSSDCSSERRYSTGQPASTRAPRVMSPLIPLKQSKYASFIVVRHPAMGPAPEKHDVELAKR